MITVIPSVDGDPELPDHLRPLCDVRFQECGELLRRAAPELDALAAGAIPELRQVQYPDRLRVELRYDLLRCASGGDETVPGVDVDRIAELSKGGNVRGEGGASGARDGKPVSLPACTCGSGSRITLKAIDTSPASRAAAVGAAPL